MALYALLTPDGKFRLEERDWGAVVPKDVTPGTANPYWVPVTVVDPPFNPATEVKEGPVETIAADQVTRTWTVRAKTAGELDAEKEHRLDDFDRLTLAVAFDHENRIRALEGKAAVTAAQFRAALKARL